MSRAKPPSRPTRAALLVLSTTLLIGITGATSASAASTLRAALKAVVTVQPPNATVGDKVTAHLDASKVPNGDSISTISLKWGDTAKVITVASLTTTPKHTYTRPGVFTVTLTITDSSDKTSTGTTTEIVTTPSGSYSGSYTVGITSGHLAFFVAPGGAAIQDVSASATMTCSPGGQSAVKPFVIDSVPVGVNGALAQTSRQSGDYLGNPAALKLTFRGNVRGIDRNGQAQVSGTLTIAMSYSSAGTAYTCSTIALPWTATREVNQPTPQPTSLPPAGSFSGSHCAYGVCGQLSFFVSADGTALQDVSASITMTCSPGGNSVVEMFVIDSLPLTSDGDFGASNAQPVISGGFHATLTPEFQGHVHGANASNTARMAGSLTMTMTYRDGATKYACTSDKRAWTATRDVQPTPQPTTRPPDGSYAGHHYQFGLTGAVTFAIADGGKAIQNVSTNVSMTCAPAGSTGGVTLVIPSLALAAGGAFAATSTQHGTYGSDPATYKFNFQGHVHGVNASSVPRLAGSLTVTMAYSHGGTAYSCSTNKWYWDAAKSA